MSLLRPFSLTLLSLLLTNALPNDGLETRHAFAEFPQITRAFPRELISTAKISFAQQGQLFFHHHEPQSMQIIRGL
jgi:hypothetical protein